jgi:hypothetical protein
MKQATFLFVLLACILKMEGQPRVVSGFVKDFKSGEVLIGATVYCPQTKAGCITNNFGFYSLQIPIEDSISMIASYVGFVPNPVILNKSENHINFALIRRTNLEELTISSSNIREFNRTNISSLSVEQIKSMPALFGEPDVLRALQSLPGISSGKEGTSGLFVRGGSPDQNLFLLDDVPLYYVNHLGGFISTFDPDALKSVKVYKGGFPAKYQGRLSSIVDIRMKDGDMKETRQAFSLGIISSKYFIESPIKKDTSSVMFSVRRCNIDLVTRAISLVDSDFDGMTGYTFYDMNFKYNHILNDKNRIYFSMYGGRDKLFINMWDSGSNDKGDYKYSFNQKQRWGNLMGSLRYNHIYRSDLFSNTTLSYSQFFYQNSGKFKSNESLNGNNQKAKESYIFLQSGAADIILKNELTYFMNEKHRIDFGVSATMHNFNPGESRYSEFNSSSNSKKNLIVPKLTMYLSDEYNITQRIQVELGLAGSMLYTDGRYYRFVEPRISSTYLVNENSSFRLSYSKMHQIVHLLSNGGAGLPTDLWIPSTKSIEPEESDQISIGFESEIGNRNDWGFTIEGFYKKLNGLIELKEGVSLFSSSSSWEEKVEKDGSGNIRGIELFLEKKQGATTGRISYTFTKNDRQFTNINNGKPYPYHYNKSNDFSVFLHQNLSEKVNISASWFYSTGFPITLAQAKYNFEFNVVDGSIKPEEVHNYNERNSSVMPDYHRLDIGIHFKKEVRRGLRIWSLSIYNVYNRQNAYYLFYDRKADSGEIGLYQFSLFPIIPSFNYSLNF